MIISRASPNEILVKSDSTSKNTIHISGAMLTCLIISRNSSELEILCFESATFFFKWLKSVWESRPKILSGLSVSWILGAPYVRAMEVSFGDNG